MSTPRHNVYLTGFSYTGNSTVGRILAARLGMEYVDTDELIEAEQGRSIPEIFAQDGEAVFRELESVTLTQVAERQSVVVATGGGMVMDPENRAVMQRTGAVVCLEAQPATILSRMRADVSDATVRPLLASADPLERITALKASRQAAYAIADWTVNTDGLTTEDVAAEAERGAEAGWRRLDSGELLEAFDELRWGHGCCVHRAHRDCGLSDSRCAGRAGDAGAAHVGSRAVGQGMCHHRQRDTGATA